MKIQNFITGLLFTLLPLAGHLPAAQMPPDQEQDQGQRQFFQDLEAHGIRGTVTGISGDTLTVKTEQGAVYQVETSPNTHIRKQRELVKISDLHPGDMVAAIGDKDDKAKTLGAIFVIVFDREQYERAKADFGKTWTVGVVQSIEDTKITIKRPDGVTQVIAVDENTSFRKHRDSITLLDIKAGDNLNARGALQNGTFVATILNVGGPMGPGNRHGPGNGPGSGPGSSSGNNNAQVPQN